MPQNAHAHIAHMHASKGSLMFRVARRARSIRRVIGGRGGRLRLPAKMLSSPRRDHAIWVSRSSDNGGGQPWVMCHARTADKYFRVVETDTGSKGVETGRPISMTSGSDAAHNAKEWRTSKEAGNLAASGIENMSQNRWNLRRPAPYPDGSRKDARDASAARACIVVLLITDAGGVLTPRHRKMRWSAGQGGRRGEGFKSRGPEADTGDVEMTGVIVTARAGAMKGLACPTSAPAMGWTSRRTPRENHAGRNLCLLAITRLKCWRGKAHMWWSLVRNETLGGDICV